MFILKKCLSALLFPLPLTVMLLIISLFLLHRQWRKTAMSLIIIAASLIYITSINLSSRWITGLLEHQYPLLTQIPDKVNRIVVLGGGIRGPLPNSTEQLGDASLARIVTAIRLSKLVLKKQHALQLILSGGSLSTENAAQAMQTLAIEFGIPKQDTYLEDRSLDTHQEAILLQPLLGKQSFILVTSGVHMPRAMALFSHLGMHPIAAPTQIQHWTRYNIGFKNFIPTARTLAAFDSGWHEILGLCWSKLRGQI